MKRKFSDWFVIHPYLFAIIPLLDLYISNIQVLELAEISKYLLGIWMAVFVIHLAANWLLKAQTRAGILTTVIAVAALYYGAFYNKLSSFQQFGFIFQSHVYFLTAWLVVFSGMAILIVTKQFELRIVTDYLNYLSIVLVLVVVVPGMWGTDFNSIKIARKSDSALSDALSLTKTSEIASLPDIYYIILDAHARSDALLEYYDFDNSDFIKNLKARGFYIASEARSNYPQTAMSLASSLNMNYLDALGVLDGGLSQSAKISRTAKLWNRPAVFEHFGKLGYTPLSLIFQGYFAGGELPLMFMNTTIGEALFPTFAMRLHRQSLLDILDRLERVPEVKKPTFVYAHILAPHPPFVFDRKGNFTGVTGYTHDNAWFPPNQFNDQIYFVEQRTIEVIDTILEKSESQPIIIIQGDHGTFSTGMKSRETLPILNAYLLPEGGERFLYPSITPVNTFRLISNIYFGTNFKLLPDRSYVAPTLNEYDSLCEAENIFPDNTEPQAWRENAIKAIKEHNYHLSVVTDCDFQKLILMRDTFQMPETFEGERFRWAGSSQKLQLPVWTTGEDYLFSAEVHYLVPPPPRLQQQVVSLLIDDKLVGQVAVRPGRQVISFLIPSEELKQEDGFVRIELRHSNSRQHQGKDFALMYFWVEWTPSSVSLPELQVLSNSGVEDITSDKGIILEDGWYPLEKSANERFRWIANDAEVVLTAPSEAPEISVEVEPGPGLNYEPFELQVLDQVGQVIAVAKVKQRDSVRFALPLKSGQAGKLRLHIEGGGKLIPTDSRTLNFRVFWIGWVKPSDEDVEKLLRLNAISDIVPREDTQYLYGSHELAADGLYLGPGWYTLESSGESKFRWVSNDAEIVVTKPSGARRRLRLTIMPGPGLGDAPFELLVLDEGERQAAVAQVQGRQQVEVELPVVSGQGQVFRLHVEGGGNLIPTDPRTLNFRVFEIEWAD